MKRSILTLACLLGLSVCASPSYDVSGSDVLVSVPAGEEALLSAMLGDAATLDGKNIVKLGGGILVNTNKFLVNFAGNIEVREGIFWVAHGLDLGTSAGKTVVSNGASLFCMMPGYLNKDSNAKPRWHNEPIEISGHGDGVKTFGALYFSKPWGNGDYESRFAKLTLNGDATICPGFRLNISGTMNMNEHSLSTTNCFKIGDYGIDFNKSAVGQLEPKFAVQNPGDIRFVGNAIFTGSITMTKAISDEAYPTAYFISRDNIDGDEPVSSIQSQNGLDGVGCRWPTVFERYGYRSDVDKKNLSPSTDYNVFSGSVTINDTLYVWSTKEDAEYEDANNNVTAVVQNVNFKGPVNGPGQLVIDYANKWNWDHAQNRIVAATLWNGENGIKNIKAYNKSIIYAKHETALANLDLLLLEHAYEVSYAGEAAEKLVQLSQIDCTSGINVERKYRGWTDFNWAKAVIAGFVKKGSGVANLSPSVFTGPVNVTAGTLKLSPPVANEGELATPYDYDLAEVTIANAGTLDLGAGRHVIAKLNVNNGNEGKIVNGTAVLKEVNVTGRKTLDMAQAAVEFTNESVIKVNDAAGNDDVVALRALDIIGTPRMAVAKKGWHVVVREASGLKELVVSYDPGTVIILR